jgi:DNA invertase Pin-like site-specific DNA recombinase
LRVVGYLRVSTDKQAEEGLGLDVQEQAIRTWAKSTGHRVVAWFRDEGVSGSNGLDARDGLAEALDALRTRAAGGLVVYRLDRLARDLVLQSNFSPRFDALAASCSPPRRRRTGTYVTIPTTRAASSSAKCSARSLSTSAE